MYTFKEIETIMDPSVYIDDIREYDVPYHVRVSIDRNVRVGKWYDVYAKHSKVDFVEDKEKLHLLILLYWHSILKQPRHL